MSSRRSPVVSVFLLVSVLAVVTRAAADVQASFRVRSDFAAAANASAGWAAELNAPATIQADRPFRLRFEVERAATARGNVSYRLEVRRNAGAWTLLEAHDFPHPEGDEAKTPRVSLVSCAAYAHAAATTDVLAGATTPFVAGAAIGLADRTPPWSAVAGAHGEFEWAVVVRRFADGAVTNEAGDTFEFRMVEADGTLLETRGNPVLRLKIPPGHVGGTFVETPGRIGPWAAANGDLYFIMEPAETSNLFMMIKSTDGGRSWREVDGANRPPTRDLESVDARQSGDTIHILHQVTRSARYHTFRTSDHPTHPDTWAIRGETAGTVNSVAQAATLVVRSDGSVVGFYVGQTKIHCSERAPGGSWREIAVIDDAVGPQAVLGAGDTVHLAYYKPDGTLWYRRLLRDRALSAPEELATGLHTTRAEFGSVLPLIYNADADALAVLYRDAGGLIWERRSIKGARLSPPLRVTDRPVVRNAVDSQQPGADVVVDGDTLHVLFIDEATRSIYSTHNAGGWQPAALRVGAISGSWVRGNVYRKPDGTKVYGYIYDAGSDGGAGMNRFGEIVLERRR